MTALNEEFALDEDIIYLNHAGVAPWPRRTAAAIEAFASQNVRSGARDYSAWMEVEARLREQSRQLLNAPSAGDIALLKNTSEALSMVAYGLHWRTGDNIVTTDQEFPSNRIVWESLARQGVELRRADLTSRIDPEDALIAHVDEQTRLLTVSSVQYATGLRMDLPRLGEFCRSRDILFCVDAIQSLGALPFDVQAIHADFAMADGHKWMLAPEGVAVFYTRAEVREQLALTEYGWHMVEDYGHYDRLDWRPAASARRFECGSPNMLGIHGLSASLSLLQEMGMPAVEDSVISHARYLMEQIRQRDALELLSPVQPGRYAGIVTFRHQGIDSDRLYRYLTQRGVVCAQRAGGIRFSPHFYTPEEKLARALALVDDCPHRSMS